MTQSNRDISEVKSIVRPQIAQMARQDERARRLMRLAGIGETTATAVIATVGGGHEFKNGRLTVTSLPGEPKDQAGMRWTWERVPPVEKPITRTRSPTPATCQTPSPRPPTAAPIWSWSAAGTAP